MKVVFVSRFPRTVDTPRGGVETATVGLASALCQYEDVDLHVVTLERGLTDVIVEQHDGITVHRLERSRCPMMLDVFGGPSARRLVKYLQDLKPDIVHFHETWGMGSYRLSIPSVFTVHGFDSLNLVTEKSWGWQFRSWLWARFEAHGLARQKHLISIAPYVKEQILPLSDAKVYNIWNAINERYFALEQQNVKENILFLGWINQRKNPLAIVEIVGLLKDKFPHLNAQLCGEASDADYTKLVADRIEALGLGERVKLRGRLDMGQVMDELTSASMLILPSLQENAPMVIAEAMAVGVPVLGSNLCGIPDMVESEKSGYLIDPHDYSAAAKQVEVLLTQPDVRQQMSGAARARAHDMFHPKSVARKTMLAYDDVLNSVK